MTQFVNDPFSGEADATLLTAHVSGGTTWTLPVNASTPRITSGGIVYADGVGPTYCKASNAPGSADYSVTTNLIYHTGGLYCGPIARLQADNSCYLAINYANGSVTATQWQVYKRNAAGSLTLVGSYDEPGFLTDGQTYAVKLECIGSSPTVVKLYIDGVQRISYSDSSSPITAAGNAGFVIYDNAIMFVTSVTADSVVTNVAYYPGGANVTTGGWTTSTGTGTLASMLDEGATPDDSDYIQSSLNPVGDVCEFPYFGVLPPSSTSGQSVPYRIKGDASTNMSVSLVCGTTIIKTWTHNPAPTSFTTFNQPLTSTEAATITDYTNLRMRVTAG